MLGGGGGGHVRWGGGGACAISHDSSVCVWGGGGLSHQPNVKMRPSPSQHRPAIFIRSTSLVTDCLPSPPRPYDLQRSGPPTSPPGYPCLRVGPCTLIRHGAYCTMETKSLSLRARPSSRVRKDTGSCSASSSGLDVRAKLIDRWMFWKALTDWRRDAPSPMVYLLKSGLESSGCNFSERWSRGVVLHPGVCR